MRIQRNYKNEIFKYLKTETENEKFGCIINLLI